MHTETIFCRYNNYFCNFGQMSNFRATNFDSFACAHSSSDRGGKSPRTEAYKEELHFGQEFVK